MSFRSVLAALTIAGATLLVPAVGAHAFDWSTRLGVDAPALSDDELGDRRGGFIGFLGAILAATPHQNTVSANIGDNNGTPDPDGTTQGSSGSGLQSLTTGQGGTSASLSANSSGPTSKTVTFSSTCCNSITRSQTSSRSFGFGVHF